MTDMTIPYPTPEEREEQIRQILDLAAPAPRRLSTALPELFRALGVRGLFFGVWDCLLLGSLLALALWAWPLAAYREHGGALTVVLFFLSPLLYALVQLLICWKEQMAGMLEQLQVCRYSLWQVNCLRMLICGGVSVVMLTGVSCLLSAAGSVSILRLLGVAFAGLFLFAAAQLAGENRVSGELGRLITPAGWILAGGGCLLIGPRSAVFLEKIPTAVFWVVTAACVGWFLGGLHRYYFRRKEGGAGYAFG